MELLLLLVAGFTFLTSLQADELQEARFIDENALRAIWDLTRQTKPTNFATARKTHYPYLAQKEKLTLQGERQTHYPLPPLNVEYAYLAQPPLVQSRPITETKDTLVDVKPIYIPYPLQNHATFTPQSAYQALKGFQAFGESSQPQPQSQFNPSYVTSYPNISPQTAQTQPSTFLGTYSTQAHKLPAQSSNIALEHNQPIYTAYQNIFAYAHQAPTQLAYQQVHPDSFYQQFVPTNSPALIIINPASHPSYHYYTASNYSFPRVAAVPGESAESIAAEEESSENIKDVRLESVNAGHFSTDSSPVGVESIPNSTPNSLTHDERLLAHAYQGQTYQPEKVNILLELLKREQLKRRMQERVAAFYFRNYDTNKK